MNTKYGATNINEVLIENENGAVPGGIELSIPCKRRRWWRINQHFVYGLGHVYNDLCAAMWFSYMMLFFQAVLHMRAAVAGAMLLLGQVVDALATPMVGVFADKYSTKKVWHLTGSIIVTCTFPLLFIRCWSCWVSDDAVYLTWWMPFYYAVLIVFFQIGWAIVQISHLAMIPVITANLHVRAELTSIRYMASVISSLMVYFITWAVLRATNYSTFIGPADDYKFRDVSLIISGIGVIAFIMFHILFKLNSMKIENTAEQQVRSVSVEANENVSLKITAKSKIMHFLRMPLLYQTSMLYVFSRLYWALSLVYVPLFLEERLSTNQSEGSELVASVPLVLYMSSLFFSFLLKSKISSCGNQVAYLIGSLLSLISSLWVAVAIDPEANVIQIYLVAGLIDTFPSVWTVQLPSRYNLAIKNLNFDKSLLIPRLGAGSSITLVSSLCIAADLIGPHSHQGASIYSIITFADKLVTGIAVVAIENYKCDSNLECPQYYRGVLTYACGGSAMLGILSLSFTILALRCKVQTIQK